MNKSKEIRGKEKCKEGEKEERRLKGRNQRRKAGRAKKGNKWCLLVWRKKPKLKKTATTQPANSLMP